MLFARRHSESFWTKARVHLWPRRSWSRSTRYVKHRVTRINATPHVIALGFAAGCFISATPFVGFHMIGAALIAWIIGGSIIASLLGTFVGNPLTYPFFWFASFKVGTVILGTAGTHSHTDFSGEFFSSSWEKIWPILKPTIVGCVPVGLVLFAIFYFLTRWAVQVYQERRKQRFQLRQLQRDQAIGAQ